MPDSTLVWKMYIWSQFNHIYHATKFANEILQKITYTF